MTPIHEVTSEVAYDLMHDHLDTILALLEGPLDRDEVVRRVGSEEVLDRMVRYGLLHNAGGTLRAVSNVYHELRQEGMMSFLEHYVLPPMTASVDGEGLATIETRYLAIDTAAARALRAGRVQALFDGLVTVSNRPAEGVLARMTVMVVGTSSVDPEADLDRGEQALRHLKQASLQRSTETERDLAVLSQYVFLADNRRYVDACAAVDEFLQSFESERADSRQRASYHLTVACHWRGPTPQAREAREQ